jgi:hypothetical protein
LSLRLPLGWSRQIARIGRETGKSNSKVARALIGAALAARSRMKGTSGIEIVDIETARSFIELWHYSGVLPTGRNVCFGWFVEGQLYAVACYGTGTNQIQHDYLARVTGLPVKRSNLFELRRLCRIEPVHQECQLSQFIAGCHRILKRDHGILFVVSFSDPAHNRFKAKRKGIPYESGGIYAASNFKHLGRTQSERHVVDGRGRMQHRRKPYHFKHQMKITMAEAREKLGLRLQRARGKDRWFIAL